MRESGLASLIPALVHLLEGMKPRGEGMRIAASHVSSALFNRTLFQKYGHPLEVVLYECCFGGFPASCLSLQSCFASFKFRLSIPFSMNNCVNRMFKHVGSTQLLPNIFEWSRLPDAKGGRQHVQSPNFFVVSRDRRPLGRAVPCRGEVRRRGGDWVRAHRALSGERRLLGCSADRTQPLLRSKGARCADCLYSVSLCVVPQPTLWAILAISSLKVCHVAFLLGTTARGSTMSRGRVKALDWF
uniref:Uncharacterized protein n=1 Tax=Ixodes ricinus TaxID=34613 RepID=A0A6B0V5I0_IXORI